MSPERVPGPSQRKRPLGQPKVESLLTNQTYLVQAVNPDTVEDDSNIEPKRAGCLAAVVHQFGAPGIMSDGKDLDVITSDDSEPADVTLSMSYGADSPENIMEDFSIENLIGKATMKGADPDDEMGRRPLLRQKLQLQVLDDLLQRLDKKVFANMVADDERRTAALTALGEEIARIEGLLHRSSREGAIEDAL